MLAMVTGKVVRKWVAAGLLHRSIYERSLVTICNVDMSEQSMIALLMVDSSHWSVAFIAGTGRRRSWHMLAMAAGKVVRKWVAAGLLHRSIWEKDSDVNLQCGVNLLC